MRNYHRQDMASAQWLATHFFAKSPQRFKQFAALPILRGDRVIDLCCGPGLYLRYISDLVGPDGHVTGLDHDPLSLDFATRYLAAFPFKNWNLIHSDMDAQLPTLEEYDVILLMNCIGYFARPIETLQQIAARARKGARIVVKDFDMGSIFLAPIDPSRLAELLVAAKLRNDQDNPLRFDNFFGRNVPFLHSAWPFSTHYHDIWSQSLAFPFNEYSIEYVWRNIEALVLQARATCSGETVDYFEDRFCGDEKPFFCNPQAVFVENEYVAVLTV